MMASSPDAAEAENPLVHLAFNHDVSNFVAATATGVRVFSCRSLRQVLHKEFIVREIDHHDTPKTIACVEMLNEAFMAVVLRSAVAGDTKDEVFFSSGLGYRMYPMGRTLPSDAVRGLRMLDDYLVVVGDDKTAMYVVRHHMAEPTRVKEVATGPNPHGLCALAMPDGGRARPVLASPHFMCKGRAQVCRLMDEHVYVRGHSSSLAFLALSCDGRLLATAGSKGTIVRVFSTTTGKPLQELRRGTDRADIHCIAFSHDSKWLVVSSDKATVHVFSVNVDLTTENGGVDGHNGMQEAPVPPTMEDANKSSSFSFFKGLLPTYFSSQWSLAQFRVREGVKYMVAFGHQPNTILIIGMDGSFYRCRFDPEKGGEMEQMEYINFLNIRG